MVISPRPTLGPACWRALSYAFDTPTPANNRTHVLRRTSCQAHAGTTARRRRDPTLARRPPTAPGDRHALHLFPHSGVLTSARQDWCLSGIAPRSYGPRGFFTPKNDAFFYDSRPAIQHRISGLFRHKTRVEGEHLSVTISSGCAGPADASAAPPLRYGLPWQAPCRMPSGGRPRPDTLTPAGSRRHRRRWPALVPA